MYKICNETLLELVNAISIVRLVSTFRYSLDTLIFCYLYRGGRICLVIGDIWAKTPNDDDILAKNLLISDN